MHNHRTLFFVSVATFLLIAYNFGNAQESISLGLSEVAVEIRDEINIRNIRKDTARLSALSTRVTGYPESANASKYIFDRFVEVGLGKVESREFQITVPIDHRDGRLEVLDENGIVIETFVISPIWPNLVRTSLLPNGIKHHVIADETLDQIAESYRINRDAILDEPHNKFMIAQASDGRDNDRDGEIDENGELKLVEGNTVFIPTGGLTAPIFYVDKADLTNFNGKDVGGFWYRIESSDTLDLVARRFRTGVGAISDDILNSHLQKTEDGIDNNENGEIDEYGEMPPFSDIANWDTDQIDNNINGIIDEIAGDHTDGIDNDRDGEIDEDDEFVAASESQIFVPQGSIVLADFNSSTRWINATMIGAKAVIFIEPESTIRGEAENKFLTIPANVPRFWLSRENSISLRKMIDDAEDRDKKVTVRLNSTMTWEGKIGQNVRGFLEGNDPQLKDEMIIVNAYYDSMSVVPSISPGADPTSGIAVMLELARIFAKNEFRPGRSLLFVATDAHFQGLAGMRAFMEGIGQDIVGRETDYGGTPTMRGLRRGLSEDLFEFEELGRKILLSIDRNVLVDLPSDFYYDVHHAKSHLESLDVTLIDLAETASNVDSFRSAQRDFKEKQKKKTESNKKREKQGFTEEEKSRLEANLAKFKKDAQQTTQFLRSIIGRIGDLQSKALTESRRSQRELIEKVALPMARIDVWAIDQIEKDLKAKKIGKNYSDDPNDSYIQPQKNADENYVLNVPKDLQNTPLSADFTTLSNYLADWEFSDPRKFKLQYAPEKVLDRHLDFHNLEKMREARRVVDRAEKSIGDYVSAEKSLLESASSQIEKRSVTDEKIFIDAISKLSIDGAFVPDQQALELYLTSVNLDRLEILQSSLLQKLEELKDQNRDRASTEVLVEDLTIDKQGIFEVALRNARLENQRIKHLLKIHSQLDRDYLEEEKLALKHYLSDDQFAQIIESRQQIAAHLTETKTLTIVKVRAENDIVELQNLLNRLDQLSTGIDDTTKDLLRNNMLTLRNARFRNIQSRVEKMARISTDEYLRKISTIEQAIRLQDTFNRYYASLFISIDLSSQNDTFGVFNKGWFYDQAPEYVLRREFASIGNKLAEYAHQADFGEQIQKLWQFTDDQIRNGVFASQWATSAGIDPKETIEGKSLETLINDHYATLTGLGGISRLMKMQFEQMKNRGEPSEDMLKDLDYIRKEVERFIRNDIRSSRKSRKSKIRQLNRLESQLALRGEDPSELTIDEIEDIKSLIGMVGLSSESKFVNAISASGGKTWRTYIPGKIAFDSEVATLIGKTGVAFATIDDARVLTDTPLDTVDRMNFENLEKQTKTLASILIQAFRDPAMPTAARVGNFYCNLFGGVVEYDARESALPNKPVPNPILTIRRKHKTMMGVRGDLFTRGDKKGNFEVIGLAMEGRATYRTGGLQEVEAYILDPDSGDIVYAPDLGNFGAKLLPNKIRIDRRRRGCRVVVFPCVSTTIYDLVDQRNLRTLQTLEVFDANTDSFPEKYGISKPVQQLGVSAVEPIALVYSEADKRIKIGMSYGQIGKRLLLIKAGQSGTKNPTLYTGDGFVVGENTSIRMTPYAVVRDMWWLDENRSRLYKRFGISSDRLDQLHQFANENLDHAQTALLKRDYSQAMKLARAAWGYESRAYPDVKKTGNDVVNGVMFYLALLMPFAYFMERLIFNFANVHRQILGTFGIFLLVFFFLAQVHPAFQITTTPVIILIAFVVLALTMLVIAIIVRKFEEQLEKIKQETSKIYKADVGRLSASAAAFRLGISNMRKRRGRTILTSITLVILTFTVISFTSVRTFMRPNRTTLAAVTPRYNGLLIRDQYWRPLEEPVLTTIMNDLRKTRIEVSDVGKLFKRQNRNFDLSDPGPTENGMIAVNNIVAPRAWYQSSGTGDQSFVQLARTVNPLDPVPPKDKTFSANMLVGMSDQEPKVTGIDRYLQYGKWFDPADSAEWSTEWPYACVLPKGMADLLGITEADMGKATISVYGANFTVTGVLGLGFKDLTDNDGEELTPVDYQLMNQQSSRGGQGDETLEGELQKYLHLTPDSIAFLPYEVVMNQGGTLRSVAVNMEIQDRDATFLKAKDKLDLIMAPLMNRIALDFFVGRGKDAYLYSAIGMTSFSGMGNLFIPILIASLIVLNTMLGAVYERVREIGIYSSVGLAPVHIAFLFLAEACVYAVIGAVIGYLFGQVVATALVKFSLLSGLTLNYSSMSTVVATIIVMMVVIGSTLYPAIKAGQMAVPDIERKWKLPEPDGDLWKFDLPFTVLGEEALGLNVFMRDYFDAHSDESASEFYTDQISLTQTEENDETVYGISLMTWLAPYDLGVSQRVHLVTRHVGAEEENLFRIGLDVVRESGEIASWKRVNRRFLNLVRKQLLIWRTFSADVRGEFHQRGHDEVENGELITELSPQLA